MKEEDPEFEKLMYDLAGKLEKGETPPTDADFEVARRDDPCPCRSGRLFKRCCRYGWLKGKLKQKSNLAKVRSMLRKSELEGVVEHYTNELQPMIKLRVQEIIGLEVPWSSVRDRVTMESFGDLSREWSLDGKPFLRLQSPGLETGDTFKVLNLLAPGHAGG